MHIEQLVKMANDISAFFQSESRREIAVHSVADHLKKFWDPRMRKQLIEHHREGGQGLDELSRAAIALMVEESAAFAEIGDG